MTTKGNLTRAQAVEIVGEAAVKAVEAKSCDFTNRVMDDGMVEFSSSVTTEEGVLTAYYYQTQADVDAADGLDALDWEIEGYEIV